MLCAPEDMWMPLWKWDQMLKACPGIQALPAPEHCTMLFLSGRQMSTMSVISRKGHGMLTKVHSYHCA